MHFNEIVRIDGCTFSPIRSRALSDHSCGMIAIESTARPNANATRTMRMFRARWGIVAAVATALAGATATAYYIWEFSTTPRGKLTANGTLSEFVTPATLDSMIKVPPDLLHAREIRLIASMIRSDQYLSDSTADSIARETNDWMQLRLDLAMRRPSWFLAPQGFIRFEVRNLGDQEVKAVALKVPYTTYWCAAIEGQNRSCRAGEGKFLIGDLRPLETATAHVWTSQVLSPYGGKVELTHASGIGSVRIRGVETPPGWWARNWGQTIWLILMALGLIGWIIGEADKRRRERSQPDSSEAK
jgi:hypothetical protein